MNSLSSTKNISKRTLTFNKSFLISVLIHAFLIFGLSITTYYKLPIFKESPIINVKFANSSQDFLTNSNIGNMENLEKELSSSVEGNMSSSRNISQSLKIIKLSGSSPGFKKIKLILVSSLIIGKAFSTALHEAL